MNARLTEQEMTKLYREIELPLLLTLYDMERDGFLVDCDELNRLGAQYDQQIAELKDEIFSLCGVAPFNLNSPRSWAVCSLTRSACLQRKRPRAAIPPTRKSLNELAELHPAVDKILLYRQVAKLKSTYIDGSAPADGPRRPHSHMVRSDHRRDGAHFFQ